MESTQEQSSIGPLHVYLVTRGSSPPCDHVLMNNIISTDCLGITAHALRGFHGEYQVNTKKLYQRVQTQFSGTCVTVLGVWSIFDFITHIGYQAHISLQFLK